MTAVWQRRHQRYIHCDGRVEEVWQLKEGGGVADGDEQKGWKESHHCFDGQPSLETNIHIDLTPIALRERWRLWVVRGVILSQLLVDVNKWFPEAQANTGGIGL